MADTEADHLRANLARYLAPLYLERPAEIAALCDEQLDRSGRLLGMLRTEARGLFERQRNASAVNPAVKD